MDMPEMIPAIGISIHALRVEGDLVGTLLPSETGISIHALRVEGDIPIHVLRDHVEISIHALRVEGDGVSGCDSQRGPISIHALRVEGDEDHKVIEAGKRNFYPRPPGGGRQDHKVIEAGKRNFYPRPPGGGRPYIGQTNTLTLPISIHALRVEGDRGYAGNDSGDRNFYPRPPGGGRRRPPSRSLPLRWPFLSTPSGWRATILQAGCRLFGLAFLSTPSGWRATAKTDKVFVCFCAKGRRICLFKTRKEKNLPVAF